jgi:hypothetical protein
MLDIYIYHKSESAGRMLDISNAQHVMSGWLLTHCPWVWNPSKPTEVDVEGSFVSSEQRNCLSGFWFRNYLRLDRTVYDGSAKYSPLCFENLRVHIHGCLQISASRAFKEVWRIQRLFFSSVLSVMKSVSDCHVFICMSFLFCVSEEVYTHLWVKTSSSMWLAVSVSGWPSFRILLQILCITILRVLLTGESLALSSSIICTV